MTITWYGGRCLLVEERVRGEAPRSALLFPETKTTRARKLEERAGVVASASGSSFATEHGYRIGMPGEYDVAGFSIRGVATASGKERGVAYVVESSGIALCAFGGPIPSKLDDRLVETLGVVDVLALPVPLRVKGASAIEGLASIVAAISPRLVLVLLEDPKLRPSVRRELGTDGESSAKLNVSERDFPDEGFRVVFLEAQ